MFKKFNLIMIFLSFYTLDIIASLKTIAIPVEKFCEGHSLVLVTRDDRGQEQTALVDLNQSKTTFSQDEIDVYNVASLSISDEKDAFVADIEQAENRQDNDTLVYLYFEVDPSVAIIRALVIKKTLLAENPFDVVEIPTGRIFEQEDDDPFADGDVNEFANINFENVKAAEPVNVIWYKALALQLRILWTMQSKVAKRKFEKIATWAKSTCGW